MCLIRISQGNRSHTANLHPCQFDNRSVLKPSGVGKICLNDIPLGLSETNLSQVQRNIDKEHGPGEEQQTNGDFGIKGSHGSSICLNRSVTPAMDELLDDGIGRGLKFISCSCSDNLS